MSHQVVRVAEIRSPFWLVIWLVLHPAMPLLPRRLFWGVANRAVRFEVSR